MKIIVVKLLKSNSEVNKDLIAYLSTSLTSVVQNDFKYEFKFIKSDGKTIYPQMSINKNIYVGLTQIRNAISKLNTATIQENKILIDNESDMHSFQLQGLMTDDGSDDGFDAIGDAEIQRKSSRFQRQRITIDAV